VKRVKLLGIGCALLLSMPLFLAAAVIAFSALLMNPRTSAPTNYESSALLKSQLTPLSEPIILKIITFNIANAYLFTTNRPERVKEIGRILTELDPDIVGLQESFIAKDRKLLLETLADSRLKYHVDFPAATVGNGLLILSAFPIVEHYFWRYRTNNPWYKIHQGDWWAGKGIGLARVQLPDGCILDFYNTHAQAGRGDPANADVRFEQMGELAKFMNESRNHSGPAFIVGDFNTRMGKPDLERAIEEAGLELTMTIDTGIDMVFAAKDDNYRFEALDTVAIKGEVQGSKGNIFLARVPTPGELRRMLFGPGEMTSISDHNGFMTTVSITKQE
jgi:endonuclease/exonuclease/phosphatase family metal-dependent hydrolase